MKKLLLVFKNITKEGYISSDSFIEYNAFFKTTNNAILAYMTPEQISNGEKIAGDKININDIENACSLYDVRKFKQYSV